MYRKSALHLDEQVIAHTINGFTAVINVLLENKLYIIKK